MSSTVTSFIGLSLWSHGFVFDDCYVFMLVYVCIVCNLDGCLAPLKCPSPGDLRSTDLRAARGASIRSMLVLCFLALDHFES